MTEEDAPTAGEPETGGAETIRLRDGRVCSIQPLRPQWAEAYRAFHIAIAGEAPFTVTQPHEVRDTERLGEQIRSYTDQPGRIWLVVFDPEGRRIIADCMARCGDRERVSHVATIGIGVRSEYHRQGIARAMMRGVIDWARNDPSVLKLELSLFAGNTPARRLYESLGFEAEGCRPRAFRLGDGSFHDEVLMGRWLGSEP